MSAHVSHITVNEDDADMRLERWFQVYYPSLPRPYFHKLVRTGQVRIDSKRVKPTSRLEPGQSIRIPPLNIDNPPIKPNKTADIAENDRRDLEAMILYQDDDIFVLNKPYGLAVQGGRGLNRHIDGMLYALQGQSQHKPRLVHRLDRETSGVLVIARKRSVAAHLSELFRGRKAQKYYWALVFGAMKPKSGRLSDFLAPETRGDQDLMRIAKHGEQGAQHALTHYETLESASNRLSWVELKPITGRTHQLRVQMDAAGHPIIGDHKYGDRERYPLPDGLQNKLHLLARRITFTGPSNQSIDVTAPLPPHMVQSWGRFGLSQSIEGL